MLSQKGDIFLSTLQLLQKVKKHIGAINQSEKRGKGELRIATRTSPKMHLVCAPTPPPPTQFNFSWDGCNNGRNEKRRLCKIGGGWGGGGVNKVYYGICANGELIVIAHLSGTSLLSADMYIPGSTVITIPGCSPRPLLTKCVS